MLISNLLLCFRNLRVVELAGGVSDKVICNALWNVGSKKSDKILDLALTKVKNLFCFVYMFYLFICMS